MPSNLILRTLFPKANQNRLTRTPLPIQHDFNVTDFYSHFDKLDQEEELFSYFREMLDNLKKIFIDPDIFLNFILFHLNESTYDLLADFGTEWLRQNKVFTDLFCLARLLNRTSVKHWKIFLDCVGREWLDLQLDCNKLYGLLNEFNDDRPIDIMDRESVYLRHYTLFCYFGKESLREKFTPEYLGNYICKWRASCSDKAHYVLLNFLDGADLSHIENITNRDPQTWDEAAELIESNHQRWTRVVRDEKSEKWLENNISTGRAIGKVLNQLSGPVTFKINGIFFCKENFNPYVEGALPAPREIILTRWYDFLNYLKPNWQETILNTPGELKALFAGNENYEPELVYLLLNPIRQQSICILQSFEFVKALSGNFFHSLLLQNKTPQAFEKSIEAEQDKPFYKIYLYAAAKAVWHAETQSKNECTWLGVSKNQRIERATLLMDAIFNSHKSDYSWRYDRGLLEIVKRLYMQLWQKEHALTNESATDNDIMFLRINIP